MLASPLYRCCCEGIKWLWYGFWITFYRAMLCISAGKCMILYSIIAPTLLKPEVWHELIRIVKIKWYNVFHKDVDIEAVACVHNLQYSSVQYRHTFMLSQFNIFFHCYYTLLEIIWAKLKTWFKAMRNRQLDLPSCKCSHHRLELVNSTSIPLSALTDGLSSFSPAKFHFTILTQYTSVR